MKVLVTGSHGFMGKHLITKFKRIGIEYFSFDIENTEQELVDYISKADFIVHLAGVMRPLTNKEFYDSNLNLTKRIIDLVKATNKNTPFLLASSTQAILDNDYGKTKKMCEDYLISSKLPAYIFRFTNAFGKWGKPNYNSVVSTFMYNIAHDLEIFIRDSNFNMHFIYIDDIVNSILKCINGEISPSSSILSVTPVHDCTLGHLAELIRYYKETIKSRNHLPIINDDFELKLFITFCDYFSDSGSNFNFFEDSRGSFEEIFKSKRYGQISVNRIKPNFLKGGHYHTHKYEIFETIKGKCVTRLRKKDSNIVNTFVQDGNNQTKVFINPFVTHDIRNIGNCDSITLMWISEVYCDEFPDTVRLDV